MKYKATPHCFYRLTVGIMPGNNYKSGTVKILDKSKRLIYPIVMLPDVLFSIGGINKYIKYNSVEELSKLTDFEIYFKNTGGVNIHFDISNLRLTNLTLAKLDKGEFNSSINLWKMRSMLDLRFVSYYIDNIFPDFSKSFIDRLKAEYTLFKQPDYLTQFVRGLQVGLTPQIEWPGGPDNSNKIRVLYLTDMGIQYESVGYTVRTQSLLKHLNLNRIGVATIGCTKFGYPYDRPVRYYKGDPNVMADFTLDGVLYTKLLAETDSSKHHYRGMNIIEYLKRYIYRVILLSYKLDVQIIHAATDYVNGLVAMYASRFLGIKSVYEVRQFWEDIAVTYKPEAYLTDVFHLRRSMEDYVMGGVNSIVTVNSSLHNDIMKRVSSDSVVIPNGVDLQKVQPDDSLRVGLREKLGIKRGGCEYGEVVVGYFGSLLFYEGVDSIISTVHQLVQAGLPVKFVYAGDGAEKDSLIKAIKDLNGDGWATYLGALTHEESVNYINVVDIMVYPRRGVDLCKSTMSSKVLEAMAMERCVVCNKLPPYYDLIEEGVNGVYSEPDNLIDLYRKVKELVEDGDKRIKLGKAARGCIVERYGWDKGAHKLAEVYRDLLGGEI